MLKRLFAVLCLLFCGKCLFSQTYQPLNPAPYGERVNRIRPLSNLHLPFVNSYDLNTNDTSAQIRINFGKLQWHYAGTWRDVPESDTSAYVNWLDSTGQKYTSVLRAVRNRKIYGDSTLVFDSTNHILNINNYLYSDNVEKLKVGGNIGANNLNLRQSTISWVQAGNPETSIQRYYNQRSLNFTGLASGTNQNVNNGINFVALYGNNTVRPLVFANPSGGLREQPYILDIQSNDKFAKLPRLTHDSMIASTSGKDGNWDGPVLGGPWQSISEGGICYCSDCDVPQYYFYNGTDWSPMGGGSTGVQSVTGTTVDNTDPLNPIVNAAPPLTGLNDNSTGDWAASGVATTNYFQDFTGHNIVRLFNSSAMSQSQNRMYHSVADVDGTVSIIDVSANNTEGPEKYAQLQLTQSGSQLGQIGAYQGYADPTKVSVRIYSNDSIYYASQFAASLYTNNVGDTADNYIGYINKYTGSLTRGPIFGGGSGSVGGIQHAVGQYPLYNIDDSTIAIQPSDATTDGYLSSTDWNVFNSKVTDVTASLPLRSTGGATPNLSADTAANYAINLVTQYQRKKSIDSLAAANASAYYPLTGNPSSFLTSASLANYVDKTVANTYTAGAKQTFLPNSTFAGMNIGSISAVPSTLVGGDIFYNSTTGNIQYYDGVIASTRTLVTLTQTQTLTNKTLSGASNTLTNIGNSSLTNSTISGISLGGTLSNLAAGYGITGTSYNGSAAQTWNADSTSSTGLVSKTRLNSMLGNYEQTITVLAASKGGTGVANTGIITLGGNLTTNGAFNTTITTTATTSVTLPTSGTLFGTASNSITSSQLGGSLSDETGTGGGVVFATAPTLTNPRVLNLWGGTATNSNQMFNITTAASSTGNWTWNGGNSAGTVFMTLSSATGNLTLTGLLVAKPYTVATLPTAITDGIAVVTDALAPTYGTTVVGGGAVRTIVYYDGTAWKCH